MIRSTIESNLLDYFLDKFLPMLSLQTIPVDVLTEHRQGMAQTILKAPGVKCAVFAGTAWNRYVLTGEAQYRDLAISYHSQAPRYIIHQLDDLLRTTRKPEVQLMVSVVFLYIHSVSSGNSERER
jgi:hypothetical protein